jgi:pimeloyl-ACP methyl ester carboxylesterase
LNSAHLHDPARLETTIGMAAAVPTFLGARRQARPVVLNGNFGWLHAEPETAGGDVAILLCPPLSWDALHSHHSLRRLADAFAALGYPTLRFNYPGTGDSQDPTAPDQFYPGQDETGPYASQIETGGTGDYWSLWQDSLNQAAVWLRETTGARRLVLAGVRIGATLAALVAATRNDVAGLALLAPVLRGKSYIRQLCMEAQLETGISVKPEDGLDFYELRLSPETVQRIGTVDLQTLRFAGAPRVGLHVAIFEQSSSRLVDGCIDAWTRQGVSVCSHSFDPLAPMLQQTIHGDTQLADLSGLLDWVCEIAPAAPPANRPAPVIDKQMLVAADQIETPVCFGDDARLFGILCRPLYQTSDIAVVIGNTGRDPHYGVARFAVEFARHLASQGIASFRIDFAGLGDSIGPAGQEDVLSPLFETDRSADISAAIDVLQAAGFRRVAVHGLCSGAYHAFHAALADPRVEALLLVNFPVFFWQPGDTVEQLVRKQAPPAHYAAKLLQRDFWARLGEREIAFRSILMTQFRRLGEQAKLRSLVVLERLGLIQPVNPARRAMATLQRRGVRTIFLFGPVDPGIAAVEEVFGRGATELDAFGAQMCIIPGVDHHISGRQARLATITRMIDFINDRETVVTDGRPAADIIHHHRAAVAA